MRSEAEIKALITSIATNDNRIRSVLLNGSRANPSITPDRYQDFDVVFIVNNIESFTSNHDWTNVFGEVIIRQLPNEMTIGTPDPDGFGYLMLFTDGNRIDLTLYPSDKVRRNYWPDNLLFVGSIRTIFSLSYPYQMTQITLLNNRLPKSSTILAMSFGG